MCYSKSVVTIKHSFHLKELVQPVKQELKPTPCNRTPTLKTPLAQTTSNAPAKLDMFQLYSTEGVASAELESFGVHHKRAVNCTRSATSSSGDGSEQARAAKKRKTRVSAEIHPLLLFEEIFWEDDL